MLSKYVLFISLLFLSGGLAVGIFVTYGLLTSNWINAMLFSTPFVIGEYIFQYLYRKEKQ